ncbi:hypothetical protein DFJ43DRAFT_1161641 [Lentinula guzmanii]|uniref:Uncharacterized protein n=1 Tax=Lentinula guzmanii TaxID=2804957 RepID=A0AA38J6R7_9AGAR|nr:hypothetical protein DFJ43DRAFT_1161641 [Lentinula guzmanii]
MSSSTPNNDTAQQRRERLLLAQAERQRARELEIARQEAEFAAEMERLEAEAAKEEEERKLSEERRVEEEKRIKEEQRLAEEERAAAERALAEEMRLEEERKAELRRFEEELALEEQRVAEERRKELAKVAKLKAREDNKAADAAEDAEEEREQNAAYVKLVEENRKEREKAVKELERRQKRAPAAKPRPVDVIIPSRPSGSRSKVFKSKAVISDDSDVMDVDKEQVETTRGVKRKRPIKMIAKGMNFSEPDGEVEPVPGQVVQPPSESSQPRPACSRCVLIGRPSECRPQSTGRQAQACAVCHQQRQRCSWSGDNAARRSCYDHAKFNSRGLDDHPPVFDFTILFRRGVYLRDPVTL